MVGKRIIAKWLKFVNHNPFGVVDLANYALECSNISARRSNNFVIRFDMIFLLLSIYHDICCTATKIHGFH